MNTYVCRRDGNALEYRTHEFRPGGEMICWQCEQRVRNGLALLPERQETPIEELRQLADDARAKANVSVEEKRERRRVRDAARKREQEKRQREPGWLAHLATIRPKVEQARKRAGAELWRPYWQKKAEQFELGVA